MRALVRAALLLAACAIPTRASADTSPAEPRLGWPENGRLSGVYAPIGLIGQPGFAGFLGRMAINGMNAIVFDAKDYSGWVTYPSTVPLVAETKAASHAVLKSLRDTVRIAHGKGVRVVIRVSCFHDPWTAQRRKDLAIKGMSGWLDPKNTEAQDYLIAIVDEVLTTAVDEVQLDYVRYPTEGLRNADFELGDTKPTDVIAGFVSRVHEHTKAAGVPLSLDIFGVVAWQRWVDVKATGQDLTKLGPLVEAVSPMVYPSHFSVGFNGYKEPGAHPEVVAFGTKEAAAVLKKAGVTTVVRPWIQGFPWHAPGYSSGYVLQEIALARASGGSGWLAWNAGGYYGEVFAASWQDRVDEKRSGR